MPLTKGQFTDAIEQLRSEGHFSADVKLSHNGNLANNYASLTLEDADTNADMKPTEAELEAAYTRSQAEQTAEQSRKSEDKAAKQAVEDEFAKDLAAIRGINPLTTVNDIKPILERMLKAIHANSRG